MVPTAMAQKETFNEERHRKAPRCDRQCEKLRGSSAITSEFDRGCGWYGKDDAYDQLTEVYLCASRLVECGVPLAWCRHAEPIMHCIAANRISWGTGSRAMCSASTCSLVEMAS